MQPPLARLPNIERLVTQQGYFVLHASRQTGKTTAMLALAQQLTAGGQYTAVMLSVVPNDDRQFLLDLGLVVRHPKGGLALANSIYRDVLSRALASESH